jgi:hypothetical protein
MRRAALAVALAALVVPEAASAHGIGGVKDLPVPLWLFYYGGAVVLVVSFVALGVLWRRPLLERAEASRPLPHPLQRVLLAPALRAVLNGASLALLALVSTAALLGDPSPSDNLAPTFVWVVFWLGLVPVVVLLGNVWSVLNPWRAVADAIAWLWARAGRSWEPPFAYPERLGRWPAAGLLLLFTVFELAYWDPADPRALALAIYLYSAITWYGMVFFGREAWLRNGEAFSVYFGLLSRLASVAVREGERGRELVLRPPLVGLARLNPPPGTLAFVAAMLGSVAFDGFSRTSGWLDFRSSLVADAASPQLAGMLVNLAGLVAAIAVVAVAYLAAVGAARAVAGDEGSLAGAFLGSLVPIALVYAVAHYFSLLVLQGQFAIPLASDPFGRGWDLLGTSDFRPNLGLLTPNAIWYVQVAALVAGHVLGLTLAHDRAVALFRSARTALRTQYAMLALMVLYTVGGLWLLSQG